MAADDDAAEFASLWNKLFEAPKEDDGFYDEVAQEEELDQVIPLANVARV